MVESVNSKKAIKQIRRGLSIYRTGRSPYWHSRIYDPVKKKYVVRSTKETNRIEAIEVAEEILETYKSKQNSSHARVSSIVLDVVAASQDINNISIGAYKFCFIT